MFSRRMFAFVLALFCLLPLGAAAAEVESGELYCFGAGDFSEEELEGVCITGLPEKTLGVVLLGDRVIRPGDILAAEQLEQMTFLPARRESDAVATVSYLPVFSDRIGSRTEMTISIRGRENQAPIAEDFAAETYKNLSVEGQLKVKDPEGETMTFTLVRKPKRGQVEIKEDGSFTYTPKKNKVGIDSFVYTATDASGKVSREATVTITIVKPTDSTQYTDTVGLDCRFAAEWMKNTGIFVGEKLDGNACFSPEKTVTQGEFLTMLVRTLEIPTEDSVNTALVREAPRWLQPYLAAAVRSGLITGVDFEAGAVITGEQAAVMIRNVLDVSAAALEGEARQDAVAVLNSYGLVLHEGELSRADAALALYQTAQLAKDAPGMITIAKQR